MFMMITAFSTALRPPRMSNDQPKMTGTTRMAKRRVAQLACRGPNCSNQLFSVFNP